jgi:hypothetical protein
MRLKQSLSLSAPEFRRAHFDELYYFANCLIQDWSPSRSGEDGVKDLEATCQAYQTSIGLD